MATTYDGINYFPINVNFMEENVMELIVAEFGIKASAIVLKLLCKIYKEGYYTVWGKEQSIIFASKAGKGVDIQEVDRIVHILLEKGVFDPFSYKKYGILTSGEIQKVWLEATKRRKRNLNALPYLLIKSEPRQPDAVLQELPLHVPLEPDVVQDATVNTKNVVQDVTFDAENACNSGQSKVKQSKVEQRKELPPPTPPRGEETRKESELLPPPPGYAFNTQTHNYTGLMEWLSMHKIKDINEIRAILSFSDYGRKGTKLWETICETHWSRIESPGKYLIAVLRKGNSQNLAPTGEKNCPGSV